MLSIKKGTAILWLTEKLFLKKKQNKKLRYRMSILKKKLPLQLMYVVLLLKMLHS